jgi:integrase
MVDELAIERTPATARNVLDALRVALRLQVEREVVELNACSGVRVPAVERRSARVLSREEMHRLQEAADADRNALIGPFVALALATGARKGELRALCWGPEGLDLGAGYARVRATMDAEEGPVATKNREARDVPLGGAVVARMRRYRLASPTSRDGDLVFPGREPREAWKRVRKAAKLADPQPVFHDLRHAVCSALRASGLESHEVAELSATRTAGGWSTGSTRTPCPSGWRPPGSSWTSGWE